jgi:predicted TIM-barrel fold metal-dependent hydrolase
MKIDVYPHFLPLKYKEALLKKHNQNFITARWDQVINGTPALFDLETRLRLIDKCEGLLQVLTLSSPPVELIADPEDAVYLSKLANDELAELVAKYPNKFAAAVACLPMNDMDSALEETDRAIKDLKLKGVQIFTPMNGKPLDSPEFIPLYEKMVHYDLPIWIHPTRSPAIPDYRDEESSKYLIYQRFGWIFDTSAAMNRLVFSGILEKYPTIKFITHHCGAMIPYFEYRIVTGHDYSQRHLKRKDGDVLSKHPIEYFRMFYADTANSVNTSGLMCGYNFFGADHILFATDAPYDSEDGSRLTREIIQFIQSAGISEQEKAMMFEGNARRLLRLTI